MSHRFRTAATRTRRAARERKRRPGIRRRVLAAWLPWWAAERRARRSPELRAQPFVLVRKGRKGRVVAATDPLALSAGLRPGTPLADARAVVPDVLAQPADPRGDARALERLARWARRFAPRAMPVAPDALFLNVGGCARLFGSEEALAASLKSALADCGISARLALADTVGAAWALARHGPDETPAAPVGAGPSGLRRILGDLPVAALRLSDDEILALSSFGLDRIEALAAVEPSRIVERFGWAPVRRLEQALGLREEPIASLPDRPARNVRRAFADPIRATEDIRRAVAGLLDDLCRELARAGEGTRSLRLVCRRSDGRDETVVVGTGRPLRRRKPLTNLLLGKLDRIDVGLGVDEIELTSDVSQATRDAQIDWLAFADAKAPGESRGGRRSGEPRDDEELADLLDRLGNRFGFDRVGRPVPRPSWLPERAVRRCAGGTAVPTTAATGDELDWPSNRDRPLRLLSPPEAVEVTVLGDGADGTRIAGFRRRGRLHRVLACRGPERLACEWWREDAPSRDYYATEDASGRRHWLFRRAPEEDGAPARWFLHGIFA